MAISINPGKMLKEKVKIVAIERTNEMYSEEKEVVLYEPRCHFKGMSARDYKNALTIGIEHEVEVFFRYDSRLTTQMRIVRLDGTTYEVKEILFTGSGAKKFMNVMAKRVDKYADN